MLSSVTALLLAASTLGSAAVFPRQSNGSSSPYPPFSGDPFKKYDLEADGIKGSWIPYGARLTNLYVKDKNGAWQDVAVGYDDGTQYLTDSETNHTYFGAVVGRYANRIKNGTFSLDGNTYHIPENENSGEDTLHGGFVGYDQANWTVASVTGNSITFSYYDQGLSNFPGDVLNLATYTLTDDASFVSRLISIPLNEATPIMLANHIYWNLGAFTTTASKHIFDNTLYMPYADRYVETDGILIPNGSLGVTNGTALDFTQPNTKIGPNLHATNGTNLCGTGCVGIDNAFILDRPRYAQPDDPNLEVLRLYSPDTGIQLSMQTNMQGTQIYTCNGQNGSIKVKKDQQHLNSTTYVEQYGCIVIEAQDWIDGINNPQWGRQQWQIFSPTSEPSVNYQKYTFTAM